MFSESVLNVHSLHTMKSSLSLASRQLCLRYPGTLSSGRYFPINMKAEQSLESVNSCHWLANTQHAPGQEVAGQPLAYRQLLRLIKGSVSIGLTHLGWVLVKSVDMLDGTGSFLWTVMTKDLSRPALLLSFSHSHKYSVCLLCLKGRRFRKSTDLRFCKSRFTSQLFEVHWSRLDSYTIFLVYSKNPFHFCFNIFLWKYKTAWNTVVRFIFYLFWNNHITICIPTII